MQNVALALLPLCALVTAIPRPLVAVLSGLDINNLSGSDPTSPPKSIFFPTGQPSNPYPSGIPTQPDQCDGQDPSNDCFNAMGGSGGYLWFDKDSQCSNSQKSVLETAVWHATTLAAHSANFPDNGEDTHGRASGMFYLGPDFASQQTRIASNLKRVWQFKTSQTSKKEYITTSCKDTKNLCGRKIGGKAVGGYAWTYSGWAFYYYYITLCPTFFTLDTLDTKLNQVEQELASGSTRMAKDMTWLSSTGQFFLHEMMHTRIAVGGVEPHIIDEYVVPIPDGEKHGANDVKAYGPRLVHALAKRSLNQGGGATRASRNADSYAILANAVWWWDTTGYFPGIPGKVDPSTAQDDFNDANLPVSLHIDLDNSTNPSAADFTSLFNDDLQAFGNGPPELDDQVDSTPSTSTLPSPPPTTSDPPPPPPTAAQVVPATGPSGPDASASPSSSRTSSPSDPAPPAPLPIGATVVTETISGKTITETYEPIIYTQFATVTAIITTTIFNAQRSPATIVVGSSGVAWTPYHPVSGVPNVHPPSVLPGAPHRTQTDAKCSPTSHVPLPSGGTIVVATLGSSVLIKTLVPATISSYASLASTITTTIFGAQSSPVTFLIGLGDIKWTPVNLPSEVPEVPPLSVLPLRSEAPANKSSSFTLMSSTDGLKSSSITSLTTKPTEAPPHSISSTNYISITDAFDKTAQLETTLVVEDVTEYWSKAIFADLSTITAPQTVTTSLVQTNKDGSKFTVSATVIIVGPGGRWWNGGTGGLGIHGSSCIWPFCPPGGGGDVDGADSGTNPNDPNSLSSLKKPSNNDNNKNKSSDNSKPFSTERLKSTSSTKSSSSLSSCGARTIASDCSVFCSMPTSISTQTCSTSCYSTITACSATGTTITSIISVCKPLKGWSKIVDGEDASTDQPLGTVGTAHFEGPSSPTLPTKAASLMINVGSTKAATHATVTSSTTYTPRCMADSNPQYSPASWCDCGSSSTYPTLSTKSGATSANCAYSTLPALTIKPISTDPTPTNIPGQGRVPDCAAIVSATGTSAYCNCGGTSAPLLSPISTGMLNCHYTIQPTSTYNPKVPPPTSAAPPLPLYATGKCNVHIWQGLGPQPTDPEVVIFVNITDANGTVIGSGYDKRNWAQTLSIESKLEDLMKVTPQTGVKHKRHLTKGPLGKRAAGVPQGTRPLFEKGPVDFAIGEQLWDTASSQCSVGAWDNGNAKDFFNAFVFGDNSFPNRQIDCKFDCLGHSKKRAVAKSFGHSLKSSKDSRRDILAKDPSQTVDDVPSSVDEHLFNVRALTDHGAAWQKYAPSGARYYAAWQAKTGDDAVSPCNLDDFFIINSITRCMPAMKVRDTLKKNGYLTDKEYYAIIIAGPKDNAIADFQSTISASQGVFLVNGNNRGALPSDRKDPEYNPQFPNGRDPIPYQFSTVAWWMWQKTVLLANEEKNKVNPSQADYKYSDIKSFWQREINNPDTIFILDEAFKGKNLASTLTWTPENTSQDTNAFWALLGSPNGNGIQYFLIDNKVILKGMGIKCIKATSLESSGLRLYTMWATFG